MPSERNFPTGNYPDLKALSKEGVRLLLFDLDGTLLDSMTLLTDVDREFLGRYGYEVTPEYTNIVKSVSNEEAARYTQSKYNLPLTWQEIIGIWDDMVFEFYRNEVRLKAGAKEYLTKARESGFMLGVTTAMSRKNAVAALAHTGILDYFNCMITLEDLGDKVNKGTPDIFLKAVDYISASASKVAPDKTLVFDDVPHAMNGARAGGFLTCAVYDKIGCGGPEGWKHFAAECLFSVYEF